MHWEHVEDFEQSGFRFRLDVAPDYGIDPPWEHEDGHGPVRRVYAESYYSRGAPRDKRPGERVLWADRHEFLLYDWQEAMKTARRDRWGLADEDRAKLAARLGREPTAGEVCAESVARDFEYLRRWCDGGWWWTCLRVTLLDVEGEPVDDFTEYLGGVESDSEDYAKECARDMAAQIVHEIKPRIGRKKTLVIERPARVERIRLRA